MEIMSISSDFDYIINALGMHLYSEDTPRQYANYSYFFPVDVVGNDDTANGAYNRQDLNNYLENGHLSDDATVGQMTQAFLECSFLQQVARAATQRVLCPSKALELETSQHNRIAVVLENYFGLFS